MTFGEAIEQLRLGRAVTRKGWNGPGPEAKEST